MRTDRAPRPVLPIKCEACAAPLTSPLYCGGCRTLRDAEEVSWFEVFSLPAQFDLDTDELRRRYLALSRNIHPDRFGATTPADAPAVARVSARVNQAYQTLLDPGMRAEYLLELMGGKSAAEDKTVPPDVLSETLEIREALEDAQAAADASRLHDLRTRIAGQHQRLLADVQRLARAMPGAATDQAQLRVALNSFKYYERLMQATR